MKEFFMHNPILFIIPGACSLGSQIALEWANVPYQIGVTTPEIRQSAAFRQVNPIGKVGALKDGENVVGENLAILLYLVDNYNLAQYCPTTSNGGREQIYQWLSYLSSGLHPAFAHFNYPTRFFDEDYAEKYRALALERLHVQLQFIDNSINAAGYLVADTPTIIDAQAFGLLRWCYKANRGDNLVDTTAYPRLQHFFKNMQNLPAVQNALAIESSSASDAHNSKFAGYFTFA